MAAPAAIRGAAFEHAAHHQLAAEHAPVPDHAARGRETPALHQLDVEPVEALRHARHVGLRHAALVGEDRQRALAGQCLVLADRQRLLDEGDSEPRELPGQVSLIGGMRIVFS